MRVRGPRLRNLGMRCESLRNVFLFSRIPDNESTYIYIHIIYIYLYVPNAEKRDSGLGILQR